MILGRYIFREIVSSALLGTLLATFVLFLGFGQWFELLIRSSARPETVLYLFALALPPFLPLSLPFGVLVGILIGLGRMAADGEITAMRAAGIPGRRVLAPVLTFALLCTGLTAYASLSLAPWAIQESFKIVNRLAPEQITANVQERVFEEQFSNSNTILYVENVKPGPVAVWQNVFIADLTPPEERKTGLRERALGPLITLAREAIAVTDVDRHRVQLTLKDASTHEVDQNGEAHDIGYPSGDQALAATPPGEQRPVGFRAMPTRELPGKAGEEIEARIELHRRFALPLACLMLALVGIPLGIATRRGGKSSGYIIAVFLAFFCYHLSSISLIGLAKQKALPVELAVWFPDAAFAIAGLILILRMERNDQRDWGGTFRDWLTPLITRLTPRMRTPGQPDFRFPFLPQIIDRYILSQFLFYFFLLLISFVLMTEIYTFFELLGDVVRNNIPMARMFTYLFFLAPKLIYDTVPVSVLVAVLVTFGVLTKHNEVTAFKASGVSVYRLATPVLAMSLILSAGLFFFDYAWVPEANRRQDAIRDEIKGRPKQTYLRPDRKWIMGGNSRIYYYRYLDTAEKTMVGVNVYEIDPKAFRLKRQISAARAQWQPAMNRWIFQDGWRRDLTATRDNFEKFQATTFPELEESYSYFLKEVKQEKQMNFWELDQYIGDLKRSGFDTVRLRVQFHKKFSVPLFALIMALISAPFAFLVGNRGAMAGIGVSIGIAIAYWAVGRLFEEIGNVSHLPPVLAAWSPDALFSLGGIYLMLKMRS